MTTIGTLKDNIPWIEKYRPREFEDIVLDDLNKQLFGEILNKQYFYLNFVGNLFISNSIVSAALNI